MVWFHTGKMTVISFNNTVRERRTFVVNKWKHFCWSGRNGGKWTLYIDGNVFRQGTKPRTRKHLTSVGTLYLGQDHDNHKVDDPGQMFEGKITELFIYNGELSKQDVLDSYNHKPRLNDVIVGWWQFKNKTSGKQIVEEHSPFFKEDVTTDLCKSINCSANAECQKHKSGEAICNCKEGFVGNGNDTCKDIGFAINFKQRTIRNIPTLHNVTFPETDSASVCFWYKLRRSPGWGYKGVVSYTIKGREDFMVWFHTGKMTVISFNNTVRERRNFVVNKWKHFCWSGRNGGKWTLYIDGKVFSQGTKRRTRKHLTSVGTLYLGQDHDDHKVDDPGQMFEGKITELFIYNGELSKQDVLDSYNHKPRLNDVIVGWWQFKNKTSGKQIVEEKSPFF
ncbi:sushi, von Willebrand factor type A, EGF and pentraxin domain-containing protein 1-like [Hydractinia symbiolongicarpus]|uniref:sushi, von Willebrand factor type A, EGF and pentraxin domain-containing protein 1-like n=1 Tax=Hydractinia symbiolongicarpus TaxID=13093 RepID=UPI002551528F|nr:sushi, von Willebrand factor type A, EGF and pentraxin domain-containing protein 1-like [Hydractinia symbiolongicarpus]